MPSKRLFSESERQRLFGTPCSEHEFHQHYSLTESELSWVAQRRGNHNRLGFAVLLCYLKHPGRVLEFQEEPSQQLLKYLSEQLNIPVESWGHYARRPTTRREHLLEIQSALELRGFSRSDYRLAIQQVEQEALKTEQALHLAKKLIHWLRSQRILLPGEEVLERLCASGLYRANQELYRLITNELTKQQEQALEDLLFIDSDKKKSRLHWLKQSPTYPNSKQIQEHLARYQLIDAMKLPDIRHKLHEHRLSKIARLAKRMNAYELKELEPLKRQAFTVALLSELKSDILDEIALLHEKALGSVFAKAKRSQEQQLVQSKKAINQELRQYVSLGEALLKANKQGEDLAKALQQVMSWETLETSLTTSKQLMKPTSPETLPVAVDGAQLVKRYLPTLLETLPLEATPAAEPLMKGLQALKKVYTSKRRKRFEELPTGFVSPKWKPIVRKGNEIDLKAYELCVAEALKASLRSGDMAIRESKQFKAFEHYLIAPEHYEQAKQQEDFGLLVDGDADSFLQSACERLTMELKKVDRLARRNELEEVRFEEEGLCISPLEKVVPDAVKSFSEKVYARLPSIKITELLMEVDGWTGFSHEFRSLKSGLPCPDKPGLMSVILSDATNLGLVNMARSTPAFTYAKLCSIQAWHSREDTYKAANTLLVNAQMKQPFAGYWGDGTRASSDGQRFQVGAQGQKVGEVNPKYGSHPGKLFYTHISDQYMPFYSQVINATIRDATYVLDGLLYHDSELTIEEHYTDTAGYTDHVFALTHLLGFDFCPRIRDLKDRKLYLPSKMSYTTLDPMIGGVLNLRLIRSQWDEILRLAYSIQKGHVSASLILRKLASYPKQNTLALALREFGRMVRTGFLLRWMQDPALRKRNQIGLNKGESRNALARALSFYRHGELREPKAEKQLFRASGLNLVVSAITLWNTVYLDQAVKELRDEQSIDESLIQHLTPCLWSHINLSGDYTWPDESKLPKPGELRHLQKTFS